MSVNRENVIIILNDLKQQKFYISFLDLKSRFRVEYKKAQSKDLLDTFVKLYQDGLIVKERLNKMTNEVYVLSDKGLKYITDSEY